MIIYFFFAFLALFICLFIALGISTVRMLNLRHRITCPDCHALLIDPKYSLMRRGLSEMGLGPERQAGFTLHCAHCSADYRFTTDGKLVGRIKDKMSG